MTHEEALQRLSNIIENIAAGSFQIYLTDDGEPKNVTHENLLRLIEIEKALRENQ